MTNILSINDFLSSSGIILDVRSPSEYHHGRIPGAINLPLFSDQERAQVGTTYKTIGRNEAVEQGLGIVGPKLVDFITKAKTMLNGQVAKVYCARGGMRSSSMAWLLNTAGMNSTTLSGGYKSFRKWSLQTLNQPRKLLVLGGYTGTGKTLILNALQTLNEQILDLEDIACHRGSSFGMIGMAKQPSYEQFENEIAFKLSLMSQDKVIWVEDESRMIGNCHLPNVLFEQMINAPIFIVDRPLCERIEILLQHYGKEDQEELIRATQRLLKRLGGLQTKIAIQHITNGNLKEAIEIIIKYYDSTYQHSLEKRQTPKCILSGSNLSCLEWATMAKEKQNPL